MFHSPATENNSNGWSMQDIDGDGKPDLVVTSQGNGTYADCFGVGSAPYWKVYLNTGSGFSSSATLWAVPAGGLINSSSHNFGFNGVSGVGSVVNNSQNWTLMDLDGDSKSDLIVTSQGNGTYDDCFGVSSAAYWKVYTNSGSGFNTTPVLWALPAGGYLNSSAHNFGFRFIAGAPAYENNSLGWTTMDLDGDQKADLIVTSQGDGTYANGFGVGASQYWKVYTNSGSGFNVSAVLWSLPAGGYINSSAHNFGFNAIGRGLASENNSQSWSTTDMDGNGTPDLVVTEQGNGTYADCFGVGSAAYWKVYMNSTVITPTVTVGLKDVNGESQLQVYPNPFQDQLTLKMDPSTLNTLYAVTDISGKKIAEGKIEKELNTVDLKDLKAGFYFIKLGDKTYKVIKE
jgi:hypothetical protein